MSKILNLKELVGLGVDHVIRGQLSKADAVLTVQRLYSSLGIMISHGTVSRETVKQLKAARLERENLMRLNRLYQGEAQYTINQSEV